MIALGKGMSHSAASVLQQQTAAALMAASFASSAPSSAQPAQSPFAAQQFQISHPADPGASMARHPSQGQQPRSGPPQQQPQPATSQPPTPNFPIPPSDVSIAEYLQFGGQQSRTLLHSYIYDYFFRAGFADAARALLQDAPDTLCQRAEPSDHSKSAPKEDAPTVADHATDQPGASKPQSDQPTAGGSDGDSSHSSHSHSGFQSVQENQRNGGGSDSSPSGSTSSPRLRSRDAAQSSDPERKPDLPLPNVEYKHPKGFLFTWWTVHWDVYHATKSRTAASKAAQAYLDVRNSTEAAQMMPKAATVAPRPASTAGPVPAPLGGQSSLPYPFNQQQQQQPPVVPPNANMGVQQAQAFARGLTRPPSSNSISAPVPMSQPVGPPVTPIQAPSPAQQQAHLQQMHQQQAQAQQHQAQQQQQQAQHAEARAAAAAAQQQRSQQAAFDQQRIQMQRRTGISAMPPGLPPNGPIPNGAMLQQQQQQQRLHMGVPPLPPGHPQYYHMMAAQHQQQNRECSGIQSSNPPKKPPEAQLVQHQQQVHQAAQQREALVGRGPPPGFQHSISRPASATAMHASPNGMIQASIDGSSPLAMPPSPSKRNRVIGQDPNLMSYNAGSPNQAHYEMSQMQQHQFQQQRAQAQAQVAQMHAQQQQVGGPTSPPQFDNRHHLQQMAMNPNQAQNLDAYRKSMAANSQMLQKGRSPSIPPGSLPPGSMGGPDPAQYAQQMTNQQMAMDLQRQMHQQPAQQPSPHLRQQPGFTGSPVLQMSAMPPNHPLYAQMQANAQAQGRPMGTPPQMAHQQPPQQPQPPPGLRQQSMTFEHDMLPPEIPTQPRPGSSMTQHTPHPSSTPQHRPDTPANSIQSPVVPHATPQQQQEANKDKQANGRKRSAENLAAKEQTKKARNGKADNADTIPLRPDASSELSEILAGKEARLSGNFDQSFMAELGAMGEAPNGGGKAGDFATALVSSNVSSSPDLDRSLWDMFVNDGGLSGGSASWEGQPNS